MDADATAAPPGRRRSSQIASSLTTLPMSLADATSAAVTSAMPSRCTSEAVTRVWKASLARIAALAAASKPSTSAVGSASAYPSAWASSSASENPAPEVVHPVEDEVGRAVDDAQHARDPVAGQRLAQRAEDRDRPGDGGLVVEVAPGLLGGVEERRPVLGEQRLVGGDDARAVLQRGEDQRAGRLDAADDLDDDVDVARATRPAASVVSSPRAPSTSRLRVEAAHGDPDQLDGRPDAGLEVAGLLLQEAHHLEPTEPQPSSGHLDGSPVCSTPEHHPTSVASRSSSVSRRTTTRATPSRTATTGGRSAWL